MHLSGLSVLSGVHPSQVSSCGIASVAARDKARMNSSHTNRQGVDCAHVTQQLFELCEGSSASNVGAQNEPLVLSDQA